MICLQEGDERFGAKSPEGVNSTFQPVFRSGSWSDKGPKQSMEDEFICVDDLTEYIGSSTGAFYGVYKICFIEYFKKVLFFKMIVCL
jgi:protein phosphatase 2C family protein 2/3